MYLKIVVIITCDKNKLHLKFENIVLNKFGFIICEKYDIKYLIFYYIKRAIM